MGLPLALPHTPTHALVLAFVFPPARPKSSCGVYLSVSKRKGGTDGSNPDSAVWSPAAPCTDSETSDPRVVFTGASVIEPGVSRPATFGVRLNGICCSVDEHVEPSEIRVARVLDDGELELQHAADSCSTADKLHT